MRKLSALLWLGLCVSSLAVTVSLVAGTSAKTFANSDSVVGKGTFNIAQANPCASKNPCASGNPCASKNPCAAKQGNVGGPLARQLQGKPVVVDIYASWCAACKNVAPTLSQLKQDYAGKAHFIVLDVSDRSKAAQSARKAQELGLGRFFEANKSQTGMIAIIDPATGNILAQHRNNANKSAYSSVLNSAISQK
jgi:thiol-disulfide isomerase/thioredoxin